MIVRVTLKDPDAFYDAIQEAVEKTRPEGLSDSEWRDIREGRHASTRLPFVLYGEYVTVEFDTDARTAVVVKTD